MEYLSAVHGPRSLAILTEERASRGIEATHNASERLHGTTIEAMQVFGRISIKHCAAQCQARTNNDTGQAHTLLVFGKVVHKKYDTRKESGAYNIGPKLTIPTELQETLTIHSKEFPPIHINIVNKWLECQFGSQQRAEQINMEK